MNKRQPFFLCADFEVNNQDSSVYIGMFVDSKHSKLHTFISLDAFMDGIAKYCRHYRSGIKTNIYFNNASKYDNFFILKYLMTSNKYKLLGFKKSKKLLYDDLDKRTKKSQFYLDNLFIKTPEIKDNNFTYFTDKTGAIYQITIYLNKKTQIVFKCCYKIFMKSVREMGLILNKFNKEKYNVLKELIDYELYRKYSDVHDLKKDVLIYDYAKNDVFILLNFLKEMNNNLKANQWKLTIASTSFYQWKKTCLDSIILLTKKLNLGVVKKIRKKGNFFFYEYNGYVYKSVVGIFNKLMKIIWPTSFLNSNYIDIDRIKNWYSGGFTHINPDCLGRFYKDIKAYDINSSYPSIMNSDFLVPVGEIKSGDVKGYELKLVKVNYFKLQCRDGYLPFAKWKSGLGNVFYRKNLNNGSLYLTNYELKYFLRAYDGVFSYKVMYSMKGVKASYIFGDYIKKWYQIRKDNNPFLVILSKLFQNSLYGKFGSNNEIETKILNKDLKWETQQYIEKFSFYLPLAIFITSLARCKLIEAVSNQYNNVLYLDTDSMFVNKYFNTDNIVVDNQLGNWKLEKDIELFVCSGKKRYGYIKKGNIIKTPDYNFLELFFDKMTISSFNITEKLLKDRKIKDIVLGFSNVQLRSIQSLKGKVLEKYVKYLHPIWYKGYEKHPECWFKTKDEYLKYFIHYQQNS